MCDSELSQVLNQEFVFGGSGVVPKQELSSVLGFTECLSRCGSHLQVYYTWLAII